MGTYIYGQVRKADGSLTSEISEETRAVLASIISGECVLIDDVREFEAFNANRVNSWDDDELAFEQWEVINAHPFWSVLDSIGSDMMVFGKARGNAFLAIRDLGYEWDESTDDKREVEMILVGLFGKERGVQLAQIIDGLYWG